MWLALLLSRNNFRMENSKPSSLLKGEMKAELTTTSSINSVSSSHEKCEQVEGDQVQVDTNGQDDDEAEETEENEEHALDFKRKTKVVEESPMKRYVRFNEKLGEGADKKVYRAWDTKNGVEVAWNLVKMTALQRRDGGKRILQEMSILQQLDHPNIIKFYASWLHKEEQSLVFITEIITGKCGSKLCISPKSGNTLCLTPF